MTNKIRPWGRDQRVNIGVRMTVAQANRLDKLSKAVPDKPNRSEMIRRLIDEKYEVIHG